VTNCSAHDFEKILWTRFDFVAWKFENEIEKLLESGSHKKLMDDGTPLSLD
jgi:hypothetical protein